MRIFKLIYYKNNAGKEKERKEGRMKEEIMRKQLVHLILDVYADHVCTVDI